MKLRWAGSWEDHHWQHCHRTKYLLRPIVNIAMSSNESETDPRGSDQVDGLFSPAETVRTIFINTVQVIISFDYWPFFSIIISCRNTNSNQTRSQQQSIMSLPSFLSFSLNSFDGTPIYSSSVLDCCNKFLESVPQEDMSPSSLSSSFSVWLQQRKYTKTTKDTKLTERPIKL